MQNENTLSKFDEKIGFAPTCRSARAANAIAVAMLDTGVDIAGNDNNEQDVDDDDVEGYEAHNLESFDGDVVDDDIIDDPGSGNTITNVPRYNWEVAWSVIRHVTGGWKGCGSSTDSNPSSVWVSTTADFHYLVWDTARQLASRNVPLLKVYVIRLHDDVTHVRAADVIRNHRAPHGSLTPEESNMEKKGHLWASDFGEVLFLGGIPKEYVVVGIEVTSQVRRALSKYQS
jgi:hypothetical protein